MSVLSDNERIVEAVLFASGGTVSLKELAECLDTDVRTVKDIVKMLSEKYIYEKRGIRLIEIDSGFQLGSDPDCDEYIKKICGKENKRSLTQPLMETLAIIAYKQPVTKSFIEDIRGVNADHAVNKLMEYGLINEKGRQDTPGKPILFGTTEDFLRKFGLSSLQTLPDLDSNGEQDDEEQLRIL